METVKIESVDVYNKLFGFETLHPLVSVFDMRTATRNMPVQLRYEYGVYALFLKQGTGCSIRYGRRSYDYQEGTIVSFSPGQVVEVISTMSPDNQILPEVYGLLFHPDLIRGTHLGQHIRNYGFFSYSSTEALHLSERERSVVLDCFDKIKLELQHSIDRHSRQLLSMNIELLLEYCLRFYERQFITREPVNRDVIQQFDRYLDDYFDMHLAQEKGLPSVRYFAEKVFLSPNYFGDLVKKETGKSAQEYIQCRLIDRAKNLIAQTDLTMSEIAYQLGFQYPQHFGRLFKKHDGRTPLEYRHELNRIMLP